MNTNQKKTNPTLSRWNRHVKTRLVSCALALLSVSAFVWELHPQITFFEAGHPICQKETK